MAINKNDYLDVDGNYDLKKELVDELIDEVNSTSSDLNAHKADIVQTTEVNSSTKYPSAAVTYGLQQQITNNSIKVLGKNYSDVNLTVNSSFVLETLSSDPVLAGKTIIGFLPYYIARNGGYAFIYSISIMSNQLRITVDTADKYTIFGHVLYI